jgi:hypothetical protein
VFEPEDIPLETTEGRRPAGAAGDRMMVGLAALALLGGALIAVGNFLPDAEGPQTGDASSQASPSAEASSSRTPRPTRSPRPLRNVQVVNEPLPSLSPQPELYYGWVRALEPIPIWSAPNSLSGQIGTLRPSEAAEVQELPEEHGGKAGWLQITQETNSGWIQPEADGRTLVKRYPSTPAASTGSIDRLIAGATGFAGLGWGRPDGAPGEFIIHSSDGATWEPMSDTVNTGESYGLQIAYGPAGWLMIEFVNTAFESVPWVSQSSDMHDWRPIGPLRDLPEENFAQLVGSEHGYVLTSFGGRGDRRAATTVWFSADGLLWAERRVPNLDVEVRLTATDLGFYMWSADSGGGIAAFSADGWEWTEVDTGGQQSVIGVVAVDDQLVVLDRRRAGGYGVWIGTVTGNHLTWTEQEAAADAFADDAVSTIVSDGARAVVFGWERGTDTPLWWMGDGHGWQRRQLTMEAFGGIPRVAAGGPAGLVVVGYRATSLGANPVIWHLDESGRWAPEPSPLVKAAADPTVRQCGSPPVDILEILTRDSQLLAHCFGDRPLTFRGWASTCDGCYWDGGGRHEPEWLATPDDNNTLELSPVSGQEWGVSARLAPSLELDPDWARNWLEVTAHFADPAAATCRFEPSPDEESWYAGTRAAVSMCRSQLVISQLRVVKGP